MPADPIAAARVGLTRSVRGRPVPPGELAGYLAEAFAAHDALAEAARAVLAIWDAPIEDDGAALGVAVDGLRGALAGRGEG